MQSELSMIPLPSRGSRLGFMRQKKKADAATEWATAFYCLVSEVI